MNDKCGGLGCMMIISFLKLHMTVSSGLPHLLEVRPASTRSNATALDESKLTLVFCQEMYCEKEPHKCFCCLPQATQHKVSAGHSALVAIPSVRHRPSNRPFRGVGIAINLNDVISKLYNNMRRSVWIYYL
ncbi:hypothetical protein HU200_020592 [Digitaria exilis]|uniref:Uncharacterized protein n=1 Tax=Digitaria exilis TaxID=1010633 RepID=A0A835F2D9_9POAL|nr:hypothetical protein HU200_020592 [Digitaria exilis]